MELNTYRLNSLEEPTDAQLHSADGAGCDVCT